MGFVKVLLLLCTGAVCVAFASECVPETAKCSRFWQKILPHTDLVTTEDELNSWCSKQDKFYQCLEDVLLEGKNGNLSYLPTNLLISKLFAKDLCSDSSTNRKRLLNNAECINQLDTDFCILPEYLDIVTPDDDIPSTRCSDAEKTFSCIAATIVQNCGFDAGRVYRTMLKITRYSDEVCGIEMSDGIPPCEGSRSKSSDRENKLSGIYYGLFHRIGSLLDEDEQDEAQPTLSEHENEAVTEAIQSAINSLDDNLVSEELIYIPEKDSDPLPSCTKDIKEYKPYMTNPHITEVFPGILFYNYSGIEYALYWRQPEFTVFDKLTCQQLLPSYVKSQVFQCRTDYRHKDPDCLLNSTNYDKVTPEFVRSFDPKVPCDSEVRFGSRPEWMKELDQMYEERRTREMEATRSQTEAPEVVTASSTLLHLVSTASSSTIDTQKWYEYDFREHGMNSLFPNEIHVEVADLLKPDLPSFEPPITSRIKVGDSLYVILYDAEISKQLENVTCSRIDECHPKGRGFWKCKWWPRKLETCDTCETSTEESRVTYGFQKYARPAEVETEFARDTTEPSDVVESVLDGTLSDEGIALVFSGDSEQESITATHPRISSLDLFNDETLPETEDSDEQEFQISEMDDDVQLEILDSILNKDEDEKPSRVVYAVESADVDNDSEILIATENGLITGKIILMNNISDLDETKYAVVSETSELSE